MTKLNPWRCCIPDPAGNGDCTTWPNPDTVNRSVALSWRLGNDEESCAIDFLPMPMCTNFEPLLGC